MYKPRILFGQFLNYPIRTSLFAAILGLLLVMPLIRPPIVISLILVGSLVYLCIFFGGRFALAQRDEQENKQPESAD